MQSFLTNALGPTFYSMGVSEADFASYLSLAMGYVYGILIALVLFIVVLIAAHWVKPGAKAFTRLTAFVACLLAITIIVNSLCFGPLRSNISTQLNAVKVELSDDMLGQSQNVIQLRSDLREGVSCSVCGAMDCCWN